jgi:hypothetical protein
MGDKMKKQIWIFLFAAAVLQAGFFCPEIKACECGSDGPSIAITINDSLLDTQSPDTILFNTLKDSIAASASCFIGTLEKVSIDTPGRKETILIRKEQTFKGKAIPDTFTVIHTNVFGGDCSYWTSPLLGQKFLCILGKDTIPKDLFSLGTGAGLCGGFRGILVSKDHLVTLGDTCVYLCWTIVRQIPLQSFITAISSSIHYARAQVVAQMRGMQVEELFSINGKRIYHDLHSRAIGHQLLIYRNKLGETRIIMPSGN